MTNENSSDKHRRLCIHTLREMMADVHVAMLTTIAAEGQLRSRPMLTPRHEFDGDLWFYTLGTDPKVLEISGNPHVSVTYVNAAQQRYVSLSGVAEIVADRKRLELLWNDELLPDLALIRVRVNDAEYWHFSAKRFGYFRSLLSRSQGSKHSHERLQWQEAATQDAAT
jgi:general stress protein 26